MTPQAQLNTIYAGQNSQLSRAGTVYEPHLSSQQLLSTVDQEGAM